MAGRLKDGGVKLMIFSLDSTNPEEHDRRRGKRGCHEAVMRGLEYCSEVGMVAHLSACVTPEMLRNGEIDRLIDFTRQSKAGKICLLPAKMMGRFSGREKVLLSQKELGELWAKMQRADGLAYVETEANVSQNIGKCFVLRDWMYVNPYGVVQPCVYVFLDFGNVREHSLKYLYRRMFEHPIFERKSILNLCLCQNPGFIEKYLSPLSDEQPLKKIRFD
jgi:MoaA/NifB/PqqE/SkfB family radical SAM enzyme